VVVALIRAAATITSRGGLVHVAIDRIREGTGHGGGSMSKQKSPPFVMVTKELLDAPAWKAASMGSRCLYIALKRRYIPNFKNNGRIQLSQRTARKEIGAGSSEIVRWFREMQYYGFIVMVKPGCLGVDDKGRAPHWRLTEVAYMRGRSSKGMEDMPTKEFLKWNGVSFSKHHPSGDDKKKTVRPEPSSAPENRSTPKTESRSRKPEHPAPENRSTCAPENRSTLWNNRSRKPEQVESRSAPENRSK
jgi:hypothetical protein